MSTVKDLINEINEARNRAIEQGSTVYKTRSQKTEVAVMRAMLNDTSYKVGVYGSKGLESEYCPAEDMRKTISSIMQNSTGLSKVEADSAVDNYEFKNNEAQSFVNFSKEFINTYLQTGRTLPLGGREKSNVSLIRKQVPGGNMLYPSRVTSDGTDGYESKEVYVEPYETIKVYGSCPDWLKHKGGK